MLVGKTGSAKTIFALQFLIHGVQMLFDCRCELRGVALHHLPDARPKLVKEVPPCVVANCRTKIVERRRRGAYPIWTVGSVDSDRTQYSEEIRAIQPPLSGVVTRGKNVRSRVSGPAHQTAAGRWAIKQMLLEQRRGQVLTKKRAGLSLNGHRFIESS